jgi:NAD(P)H-nitrite reductase large subunit
MGKIIDCRLLKDWDPKKRKNDAAYEYYVHYADYNRRMDEWISRNRIELTRQLIEEDHMNKKKRKTEEKKFDNNIDDEHEGKHPSEFFSQKNSPIIS